LESPRSPNILLRDLWISIILVFRRLVLHFIYTYIRNTHTHTRHSTFELLCQKRDESPAGHNSRLYRLIKNNNELYPAGHNSHLVSGTRVSVILKIYTLLVTFKHLVISSNSFYNGCPSVLNCGCSDTIILATNHIFWRMDHIRDTVG
jgi:hypothetical protein